MVKKLSELAGQGSEGHLATTIRNSATNIWLAGLGAFAKAQEEGGKLFDALVKEGEAVQSRASKSAQEAITDARTKATGTWDKLEQVFVDRGFPCADQPQRAHEARYRRARQAGGGADQGHTKLSHSLEGGVKKVEAPAKKAAARAHN